jgi:hypothetical protein
MRPRCSCVSFAGSGVKAVEIVRSFAKTEPVLDCLCCKAPNIASRNGPYLTSPEALFSASVWEKRTTTHAPLLASQAKTDRIYVLGFSRLVKSLTDG